MNENKRQTVRNNYARMEDENAQRFARGDVRATTEYIFPNQKADAAAIVRLFEQGRRVVSISKLTKVGMDGLMIQIAYLMATHPDDAFLVDAAHVHILTGMNNVAWETEMQSKAPKSFRTNIYHHGKLHRAKLTGIRNALLIIDEIDTGDKEFQVLHRTLRDAGILDAAYLEENNIRFVFASATMLRELYDLDKWGQLHELYKMTIPAEYIGHKEFLERGVLQEFYPLKTVDAAEQWIQEDILDHYGSDFRVHLVRQGLNGPVVKQACLAKKVFFFEHNSENRLSEEQLEQIFERPLPRHVVIGIKGFFRRANLIPNAWKLRIGATHEQYTKQVDNNVQIQGLPGRMSGYWRSALDAGHKTGPHRTSLRAVEEYTATYEDPFGENSYRAAGFTKKNGKITRAHPTMVATKHVAGLVPKEPEVVSEELEEDVVYVKQEPNPNNGVINLTGE
jgi:hypothetical protein